MPTPAGIVHADSLYTLDSLRAELGVGVAAMRQMRRAGLPVRRVGKRSYVIGADVLGFIREHGRLLEPGDDSNGSKPMKKPAGPDGKDGRRPVLFGPVEVEEVLRKRGDQARDGGDRVGKER